jgi:hypothetical protein
MEQAGSRGREMWLAEGGCRHLSSTMRPSQPRPGFPQGDLHTQLYCWGLAIGLAGACSSPSAPERSTSVDLPDAAISVPDDRAQGRQPGAGGAAPSGEGGQASAGGSGGTASGPGDGSGTSAGGAGGVNATNAVADAAGDGSERTDAAPIAGDFKCTELVGLGSTREWYQAGFETAVVNARWQLRWHHRGYIEDWADAKNPYWGMYSDGEGCWRVSACAEGADAPDRVVFVALNWIYTTEQQWEIDLRKDVDAIATKYPSVRNIEIISSSRCPDRCTTIDPPGTMSELTAIQTCRTPDFVDQAIAAVAASNPALVTVGPKFFSNECGAFVSLHGPHLTAAGQKEIAAKVGAHYAAHP